MKQDIGNIAGIEEATASRDDIRWLGALSKLVQAELEVTVCTARRRRRP
jgi:hypothetical protein